MEWLNYHHLFYFWTIVIEGSIAAASRELKVGRPSISMQLKSLETFVGSPLFLRRGRQLELTETGKLVFGYADEIFQTGRELVDAVRGRDVGKTQPFRVGIADVMAKMVAFQLLLPAFDMDEDFSLVCREDHPNQLFAQLALHELDLVLSDIPLSPGLDVKAYNHVAGESTTTLFAAPKLARKLKENFPASLSGAPFLMPARNTAISRPLTKWLEENDVRANVVGEFDDSALMKVFGQAGRGFFPGPTVVSERIQSQYGVQVVGELDQVRESFYAISPERKVKHPAVACILDHAKRNIFHK
ncbi:MAG: LysR family transcriptional activator of nhaA [Planctomycetota bacterium]|jgi:LysR family transcriptional activator of nhaA